MKSVLVVGGVRNTGLSASRRFAKEGWAVFLTSRVKEDADRVASEISEEYNVPVFGLQYDINDIYEAPNVIAQIEKKGFSLNSVALCSAAKGMDTDPLICDIDYWASVINANVVGNFSMARAVGKHLVEHKKAGTIVFVGSITCQDCNEGRSSYNASKGAILSITKSLAVDLGKYGIRTNCIMPGPIYTERYDALDEETRKRRNELVPIGRVSTADDIASGIYFLASEQSGNMNGTGMIMDGGVDCINSGRY